MLLDGLVSKRDSSDRKFMESIAT